MGLVVSTAGNGCFWCRVCPRLFLASSYFLLEDKPFDANWLSRDEKQLLDDSLQHDVKDVESETAGTFREMLRDPKVYLLSLVYFLLLGATYTMVFGCRH